MTSFLRKLIQISALSAIFLMSVFPISAASASVIPVTYGATTVVSALAPNVSVTEFVSALDTNENVLKGIYLEDAFALRIVQQPIGQAGFVSTIQGVVTQFAPASDYGVIGLLAHNYLAGSSFSSVVLGDVITVANGDGLGTQYIVTSINQFQALSPNSTSSKFVDLVTQEQMTAGQLFKNMYQGEPHMVLQTCIAKDGEPSWGRLFIIAEPVDVQG